MKRTMRRGHMAVLAALAALAAPAGFLGAGVKIAAEWVPNEKATAAFDFKDVPRPAQGDAATGAKFTVLDGRRDANGGELDALHDGRLPSGEDEPSANFFFAAGTDGGRLLVDLGSKLDIAQVNTYSWHPGARGPQVYTLYGSAGEAPGFNPRPERSIDPLSCGWKLIAAVDTRSKGGGGQHGVSLAGDDGVLGAYRYLLFAISRTEAADPFGNTFYSEIDVLDAASKAAVPIPPPAPRREIIAAADGAFRITIDTTDAPDLSEWVQKELAPVVKEWYPKIADMLSSKDFKAPAAVTITFSSTMRGVAATAGARVNCAARWYRSNLRGEAKGSVVHELVHVVQQYGRARGGARPPGWLVEGIADYIRWFKYEPEARGAEIDPRRAAQARYDASYRVSANFLDWVARKHAPDIVKNLNAALREGRYREDLWKEYTGRTLEELGAAWKESLAKAPSAPEGDARERP
ncbi:MAG: Plant Basic Secretory Protein [Planctomycetes bacterium ADurb.Bin069]|nr:MAG: Plant Basic Secretory Protein [Planctomycetes bacterium ADurb.Bin069]